MKRYYYIYFVFVLLSAKYSFGQTTSIITDAPIVGSSNTRETRIDRVEITSKYTIIYLSFKLRNTATRSPQSLEDLMEIFRNGGRGGNSQNFISISPSSKLIDSKTGKKFKYLKASGIPEEPEQLDVYAGEKVNFKVYYQKLDPGVELIDFYEGENNAKVRYWNFNKVQINNPGPKDKLSEPEMPETVAGTSTPIVNILLKGKITDAKTGKGLNAKVEITKSGEKQAFDSTMSFFNTGAYKTILPESGNYTLTVSLPGYLVASETVNAQNVPSTGINKDILLSPITAGDVVLLEYVYFETAQYTLLQSSNAELDKMVNLLANNPSLRILLEGHTDIVGDKNSNQVLSEQRVFAVKDYLVSKGIDASRIETKGWGSSKPLNANGTDAERSKNRRVEFRILSI